jgi:two-component system CheB/CheR fusion protein
VAQLIFDTCSIKTTEKEIDFSFSIDKNLPVDFIGDSARISQILYNLISNAVKFTPQNGKIKLQISNAGKENNCHYIQMAVTDNGIGIPSDKIDHIFDPFIQVSNDAARSHSGTGLGLAIVKRIISKMNGGITVESALGKGTTFIVTIPLKESDSSLGTNSLMLENCPLILTSQKKIKVLLAEDNRINQLLAQKVLSDFKFDFVTVENGKQAIEAVLKEDFDVILMDLMMPEMDGYEATTVIRSLTDNTKNDIPIIALTAVVIDSVTDKCASIGVNKYLSKPYKSNELYEMIMELVAERVLV